MGAGVIAMSATSFGMRRWVIASGDIPSAESWWMSLLESSVMGTSASGVGGMVVLRWQVTLGCRIIPSGSVVGRRKCL